MSMTPNTIGNSGSRGAGSDRTPTFGDQTKKVADDVRELGSMAVAGAGEALQSVKERGNQVVKGARETFEQGKEGLAKARDGFEGYVSDNPFKSILIAAGIGALIGYSLRRRE